MNTRTSEQRAENMKNLLELLPLRFQDMIKDGKALLLKNGDGVWLCYEKGCFKVFRKFETFAQVLVALLNDKCMTASEVAHHLVLPYKVAKDRLYYYYKAGLLTRRGPYYCLNDDHPQILFFYKMVNKCLFSEGENRLRFARIGEELTSSRVFEQHISSNNKDNRNLESEELSIERVLAKARELAGNLSESEILIIVKLVEWRKSRGKWYVCAQDPHELSELLNIDIDTEALKRLEKLGIVYRFYDRRHRQHCFRISRSLVAD